MPHKKINILHLRDSPWVDGPGRTIIETGCSIDSSRYGYSIGAFCSKSFEQHPFIREATERNLTVFPINEVGQFDPKPINKILRLIDEQQIHVLHSHEVRSDFIGLLCARVKRIPIVTTIHGWISNEIKGQIYTAVDKALLRFFDRIIVVSEKTKEEVLETGVVEEKVSVLHNALVLDTFRRDRNNCEFRRELAIPEGTTLIANIGRLSPEKGQADFLLAAREILRHHDNVHFVLIGTGPDQSKLEQLAKDFQIQHSVTFAGFRTDMPSIYNNLDLVIQSSYTEGMPNVILEALLMEVPVLATDAGGTAEIISNGRTGVLIPHSSPEDITRNTLSFLKNPAKFKQMARQGKSIVKEKFNFPDRTKKLSLIYDKLMGTR